MPRHRDDPPGGLLPVPQTLQDSLQVLIGGGGGGRDVPVMRSSEDLDNQFKRHPAILARRAYRWLTGAPPTTGLLGLAHREAEPKLRGLIPGQKERITLRDEGDLSESDDRFTMMHEFGHVDDFRQNHPEAYKALQRVRPRGKSKAEHYADTYAFAVEFLQSPGSRDPVAAARLLERPEPSPGFRVIMEELLKHPLYANHPLAKGHK